ncbi:phage virion morphogenesis protein [Aeromonas veronii]
MITITLDARRSQDQLNLLALPPQKRKRLVWRAAAELGFKRGTMNAHAGVIANTHQKGHTYQVTAASRRRIANSEGSKLKPATKAQARKLRELGFKRPGARKGSYRSASLGWITGNLNYAQAGLLIRKLKDEPVKASWEIELPARPFLGANTKQREQAFARALQSIDYGWDVNKQEMKGK